MSFTNTVPGSVPSLFHSSAPFVPLFATKYSVVPTAINVFGSEAELGLMFFTITVPAAVPSLFQSSAPFVPSSARK